MSLMELNEVMGRCNGAVVRPKKGGRFRFLLHLTPSMSATSIEALDLSVRGFNCLRRAGYETIGDVAAVIEAGNGLTKIRSCGKTTIQEIMIKLFLYQYSVYSDARRERYLLETVALNVADE